MATPAKPPTALSTTVPVARAALFAEDGTGDVEIVGMVETVSEKGLEKDAMKATPMIEVERMRKMTDEKMDRVRGFCNEIGFRCAVDFSTQKNSRPSIQQVSAKVPFPQQ